MKKAKKDDFKEVTKKRIFSMVSILLAIGLLADTVTTGSTVDIKKRNVDVSSYAASDKYTSTFEKSDVTYSEQDEVVNFVASGTYSDANSMLFDNVSLEEECYDEEADKITVTGEDVEEEYGEDGLIDEEEQGENLPDSELPDDEEYEDAEVDYECSFDMNELVFDFTAELVSEDGTVLETQKIETDAIITENGGLDACIVIDGETYMLSDYEKTSSIDECSIASVMDVINAYLAVAETAEKIKAKSNYKYNKKLESKGNGVGKGYYIYNQSDTSTKNRKAGKYRFGFTTFKNVGCEVASAYNVALALDDSERLSQTIYYFEAYSIEFSIAWGNFGSNPLEIYRYLKKRGFSYSKYTSYSSFSTAVSKKSSCKIIMSRWNSPIKDGLHTFYISKTNSTAFYGYNWKYDTSWAKRTSLDSFNNGSGFIVGYIVWK